MGVSVEWFGAIAEELGVSRPALYNYVVDREDLLFKCYLRSCERFESCLRLALEAASTPLAIIEQFLSQATSAEAPETAVLSEIDALTPEQQTSIRARWAVLVARLAAVLDDGVAQGLFRPMDTTIVANALIAMASWPPLHGRWAPDSELTPGDIGAREILFGGLAADRDAPLDNTVSFSRPALVKIDLFDRQTLEEAKRQAILVTASSLFNRRGIGATRVEDVGAAVNLSKRAVYHHIGNKGALINACIVRSIALYLGIMDEAERAPNSRLEVYFSAVRSIVENYFDPQRTVLAPYVGSGLLNAEGRSTMSAFTQRLTDGYRKIFMDGQREGSIRALPLDEVLAALPGVFSWAASSPVTSTEDPAHVAEEIAVLAIRGILA
jgi:AcrR family transcriptional regulator